MYTLSAGIWEKFFKKKDYYVVIVGLDNAGKTTFLEQTKSHFVKDYGVLNPSKITATVGLNSEFFKNKGFKASSNYGLFQPAKLS
ncbi:hypothetical protein B9Z55_001031 [Caenorhabditis nigoni]|uniref:ADP-ribosylation factor-related protein 1 n=1 Tax=Caenorhabditis nigoni TaxID=1611254 RepID=A0A2G5VDX8_9PELO|nr:hypothetical protein B9Z55_001031 [Caenorhabditis nigoni]